MKSKILTGGGIIILVFLCGAIVLKTFSSSEAEKCQVSQETTSSYVSSDTVPSDTAPTIKEYFQADLPKDYSVSYHDSDFEAILHYKGEEIGYLSFYKSPEKSAQSFVSSIEGMHAYPKDEGIDFTMNSYLIKKVTVLYELSAAEREKGNDIPEEETHYYFYTPGSNTDVVGDLYVKSGVISSAEMDELAKSIVPTKESKLY
ncbi:MAG: hypothetical protein IKL07_08805 [Clostridium sp.]|nr:hypothetical protein [Clostridium sp.]